MTLQITFCNLFSLVVSGAKSPGSEATGPPSRKRKKAQKSRERRGKAVSPKAQLLRQNPPETLQEDDTDAAASTEGPAGKLHQNWMVPSTKPGSPGWSDLTEKRRCCGESHCTFEALTNVLRIAFWGRPSLQRFREAASDLVGSIFVSGGARGRKGLRAAPQFRVLCLVTHLALGL